MTLYMFRTVFPSIIRSSRLYIQQQVYVKQILLSACSFTIEVNLIFYTNILISWTIIKLEDLGCAGHGIGKADEMISKKVLKGKFRNRRPV